VPRIPPADLNCAFYLYPSEEAAKAGVKLGGSGFWVGIQSLVVQKLRWLYAVSNRHVVHSHGASVIRANGRINDAEAALKKAPPSIAYRRDGQILNDQNASMVVRVRPAPRAGAMVCREALRQQRRP
jgi:hypothetical protein